MHRTLSNLFKPLSKNKAAYVDNTSLSNSAPKKTAHMVHQRDIQTLAQVYEAKLGCKIVLNGQTDYGRPIIQKRKKSFEEQIAELKDDKTKYVRYIQEHWVEPGAAIFDVWYARFQIGCMIYSKFSSIYEDLKKELSRFLYPCGTLPEDLSPAARTFINSIVSKNPDYSSLFNNMISEYITAAQQFIKQNCGGLDKSDAAQEIEELLSTSSSQQIFYLFSNGNHNHVELVILENGAAIKPITWNVDTDDVILPEDLKGPLYHLDSTFSCFYAGTEKYPPALVPQAGEYECATLNFLYWKELVKNNADQLKNWTLRLSIYTNQDKLCHVFIPSPQTLRYTQVSDFNRMLEKILTPTDKTQELKKDDKTYYYHTLQTVLTRSLQWANAKGNKEIVEHNTKMLAELPTFSERWLAMYKKVDAYRTLMYGLVIIDHKLIHANALLIYHTQKNAVKVRYTRIHKKLTTTLADVKDEKEIKAQTEVLLKSAIKLAEFAEKLAFVCNEIKKENELEFSAKLKAYSLATPRQNIESIIPIMVRLIDFVEQRFQYDCNISKSGELALETPTDEGDKMRMVAIQEAFDLFDKLPKDSSFDEARKKIGGFVNNLLWSRIYNANWMAKVMEEGAAFAESLRAQLQQTEKSKAFVSI